MFLIHYENIIITTHVCYFLRIKKIQISEAKRASVRQKPFRAKALPCKMTRWAKDLPRKRQGGQKPPVKMTESTKALPQQRHKCILNTLFFFSMHST
jgi:hypothetical protein